jgi:membrane dipeptidase
LKASGVTAIFKVLGGASEKFENCVYSLGFSFSDIEKNQIGKRAFLAEDIKKAKQEDKIAFIAATETNPFSNMLDRVEIIHGLGFRSIGMTFDIGNYFGSGSSDPRNTHLSPFGLEVVKKINELGMIIDISHAGENTSLDVIEVSKDPVIFSHNGLASIYPEGKKCLTDEQVLSLAEKCGIIGIHGVPNTLSNSTRQGVKDWFKHLDYCVNLIGVNNVAVGLDINWQDQVAFHRLSNPNGYFPAEYMEGLENPTEAWHNIFRCLVYEGYSEQEIEKIVGANAIRILENVVG